MNPRDLIDQAQAAGVTLRLDNGKVILRGDPEARQAVGKWLRPHKVEILEFLSAQDGTPEIAGEFTPWCAPIDPPMVDELHRLMAQAANRLQWSGEETARIIEAAKRQSCASVPASIEAFRNLLKD